MRVIGGDPSRARVAASTTCLARRFRAGVGQGHSTVEAGYLILNRWEKEWKMPPREWSEAKAQFAVIFGEGFIRAILGR